MSSRRRARSPAVTPLDDDDLLSEILLRLPPKPSSLPRASLVCKRWCRLVSDRGFFRRFRLHHRRNPPLLGFFDKYVQAKSFLPALEAPNRIPPQRFSLQRDDDDDLCTSLGCRHGLLLICIPKLLQVLVWDPITGDRHRIAFPAAFDTDTEIHGAVLRDAGDDQHFQVVLAAAGVNEGHEEQAFACVYSWKTGLWGNLVSTPIPYQANEGHIPTMVDFDDAVLAGRSLYWKLANKFVGLLEFDLERQSLAVIRVPVDMYGGQNSFTLMRAEGSVLGFLCMPESDCTAQLWRRTTNCDGVASWGLARTIELDKLLSLKLEQKWPLVIQGYAEEGNVVFLWTMIGLFMIHLDSLEFKKLLEPDFTSYYHLFESFYPAGARIGGGHDGAELLVNT